MLQFSLAIISGASCESRSVKFDKQAWVVADALRSDYGDEVNDNAVRNPIGTKSIAMLDGLEVFVQKARVVREERELKIRCWAMLLAHMTGFAGIQLGGTLQHLPVFQKHPLLTVVAMIINELLLLGLFRAAQEMRKRTP